MEFHFYDSCVLFVILIVYKIVDMKKKQSEDVNSTSDCFFFILIWRALGILKWKNMSKKR